LPCEQAAVGRQLAGRGSDASCKRPIDLERERITLTFIMTAIPLKHKTHQL
jgi:hypothetical protein